VLHCVALRCSVLLYVAVDGILMHQFIAVSCSVLHCVTVRCIVWQCVTRCLHA